MFSARLASLSPAPATCGVAMRPTPNDVAIDSAAALLRRGEIIAIKGLDQYQLACDATNAASVTLLRANRRRGGKPFVLMARDTGVIRRYCVVSREEERELTSVRAPIVLLSSRGSRELPRGVAPGVATLGFMLPATPLHARLLREMDEPLVMTGGNRSGEPPIIDDAEAPVRLAEIASHILSHDRGIANRIGASVVRVMDSEPRVLRRARGYAPAPIELPAGFERATGLLALGCERRAAFCLIKDGQAILSWHHGDPRNPVAFEDYQRNLTRCSGWLSRAPRAIAADMDPDDNLAATMQRPLFRVHHDHAHVASCLCENGYPLDGPRVLGIVLDGSHGRSTSRAAEFLLAGYRGFERAAVVAPMDGCLFEAVSAALGIHSGRRSGAVEAAAELEAIADHAVGEDAPYAFALSPATETGPRALDPAPMWRALFSDLARGICVAKVAARFHAGFARALADTAVELKRSAPFQVVALSGDCCENRLLFEQTTRHLTAAGFVVLSHSRVPANDSGIALGQAAVVAAQSQLQRTARERMA